MNQFSDNFVVIDLETSGLIAKSNPSSTFSGAGILELGAVDANERRFYRRVALQRGRYVDAHALMCNGIDPLDLGAGQEVGAALCDLLAWLRCGGYLGRWIMGGKNPKFDYDFLKIYWPKNAAEPLRKVISRRCVDLHSLVYGMALRSGWYMTADDFSTDDLYCSLGLEPEPTPHNALRGAIHEMEAFRRVLLGAPAATPQAQFDALMEATARGNLKLEDMEG